MHDALQSATWLDPLSVHRVIVPSALHAASVPVQRGKHVELTEDDADPSASHVAVLRAAAHVAVTRSEPYCFLQPGSVSG